MIRRPQRRTYCKDLGRVHSRANDLELDFGALFDHEFVCLFRVRCKPWWIACGVELHRSWNKLWEVERVEGGS